MKKFDPVEVWLSNVAYSRSKSESTESNYRLYLKAFCRFLECTPQQIIDDLKGLSDREFRRKYGRLLKIYISQLTSRDYTTATVNAMVTAVKSFFKYSDLPLAYIPTPRRKIAFHNRDITKQEIQAVINISNVRDRAFFTVMSQSGQRPFTLCQLKRKHIEPEFSKGVIPCKIEIPEELAKGEFGAYFAFMGEDSVRLLRTYFNKRGTVGPEDYLFTKEGTEEQLNRKSATFMFSKALDKLKETGIISFEQKVAGKPREVRLYSLRKWFRKQAAKAGIEYVNFWMGHKANYQAPHIPDSDAHYFSREDVEFHRQLYKEKAMPFLRLESKTPGETEQTIMELRSQLAALREELQKRPKLDPLLQEIEVLTGLPHVGKAYRKAFADIVEYAKKRFAEQLKQEMK